MVDMLKKYKVFLFDFDYTLADSSEGIVFCFQTVLRSRGYTDISDEEIKRTIGKTLEESFSILTKEEDESTIMQMKKEYVSVADVNMNSRTHLYPDTVKSLNHIKDRGILLGIISTKYRYRITSFMADYFSNGFFDIIIGGEDVKIAKPSPEGILKSIEILKVDKKEVLYVGDSTIDAETAERAGVDFVGVLNGMTTFDELNKYKNVMIAKSLTEISNCL